MDKKISHDRKDETIEAKTRWFRSIPLSERMELFCSFTDLALNVNPGLPGLKNAKSTKGRIQILSKEDLISSKRATGRDIDLEDVRLLELTDNNENT